VDPKDAVTQQVRSQSEACAFLGSDLYAGLLDRLATEIEKGGPAWGILEPFASWDPRTVYVLRVMGAVHRLVLAGEAPDLAGHFKPGGDAEAAWPAFADLIGARESDLRQIALEHPVQTNEVGRCAALAPAIVHLAQGRPVRLLELGSSAGLNLRFDAYRYEDLWGPADSPVKLVDRYEHPRPPFAPPEVEVTERRGCDMQPIDPRTEEGRLTLLSYVWPDQPERAPLLGAALELARHVPASVDQAPADEWLDRVLETPPPPGAITIVFHSIVWLYLDEPTRARITSTLESAGARATPDTPLAWLRMEADAELTRVDATLWPGGESSLIARAGYHGKPVQWLVDGKREGAGGGS
jgi:hypothetical protein